jgi:glycosyltransferase involved in cell wall biosynthesis
VIVLPSEGPGETWGLCINEAMNLGLPAIVSSHVGCGPDLVLPGRTGWVVPAGDRRALGAILAEALADPQRLQRYGEAARQRVALYGYDATTAGLLQALALTRRSA